MFGWNQYAHSRRDLFRYGAVAMSIGWSVDLDGEVVEHVIPASGRPHLAHNSCWCIPDDDNPHRIEHHG